MNEWILVIGMMLVTFLPRYLPIALAGRVELPAWLHDALGFVPIAVLTALVVQVAAFDSGELVLNWQNAQLWAVLAAGLMAMAGRNLLSIIAVGVLVYGLARWLL